MSDENNIYISPDDPVLQQSARQAIHEAFAKSTHFDETLLVFNHWLMTVHDLNIMDVHGYWHAYSTKTDTVDIRRETYSQCLSATLDHIAGRKEGS